MTLPIDIVQEYPSWMLQTENVDQTRAVYQYFLDQDNAKVRDTVFDEICRKNSSFAKPDVMDIVVSLKQDGYIEREGTYYYGTELLVENEKQVMKQLDSIEKILHSMGEQNS